MSEEQQGELLVILAQIRDALGEANNVNRKGWELVAQRDARLINQNQDWFDRQTEWRKEDLERHEKERQERPQEDTRWTAVLLSLEEMNAAVAKLTKGSDLP